ncbi:uncharacterized protein EI97DRAFT_159494 [Westerdykella ornata]|uniref:Uncharacterized protein n=1 Tax=Westerdykella ornata TaxID=318751 RepID=A0A6A6JB45_WESOR|nr:uncharacterized protein EI97DRAFT_159494 [Westerdykella ornata]KAF2273487.1 hypothetical protein EI97DRAFT_159494 [Westerdykella ornata]
MRRQTPVSVLVYNYLFPNPTPHDPISFHAHLTKNLVGEVRIETNRFYGGLETVEARYPGLNYTYAPHRKRLSRFPHHKRLFEAFDALGLTESEILGLCRWEGTIWARERYERDEGVKVRDTTGEEIGPWVDRRAERRRARQLQEEGRRRGAINVKTDIEVEIEEVEEGQAADDADAQMEEDEDEEDAEEEDTESIGFALNQRLLHAAFLRDQGHTNVPMDPEWEQYLKEAQERGDLSIDATREVLRIMARGVRSGSAQTLGHGSTQSRQPPPAPA